MKTNPHSYPLAERVFPLLAQALLDDASPSIVSFYCAWPGANASFPVPQCLVDLVRNELLGADRSFVASFTASLQLLGGHWISEAQVTTLLALAHDEEGLALASDLDIEIEVDPDGEAIALCAGFALAYADGQWRTLAPALRDLQANDLKTAITAAHRARLAALEDAASHPTFNNP